MVEAALTAAPLDLIHIPPSIALAAGMPLDVCTPSIKNAAGTAGVGTAAVAAAAAVAVLAALWGDQ